MDKPNWTYWTNLADVGLSQAVELSCGIALGWMDSGDRYVRPEDRPLMGQLRTRLLIAQSHVSARTLTVELRRNRGEREYIALAAFRTWGESLPTPFTFPDEFPKATPQPADALSRSATRWPWGDHETKLLRHLASAGERYWKNYDPNDPSTANSNETVSAWLKGQGVAKRVAEVMAQILRAEGLRTGPR